MAYGGERGRGPAVVSVLAVGPLERPIRLRLLARAMRTVFGEPGHLPRQERGGWVDATHIARLWNGGAQ